MAARDTWRHHNALYQDTNSSPFNYNTTREKKYRYVTKLFQVAVFVSLCTCWGWGQKLGGF